MHVYHISLYCYDFFGARVDTVLLDTVYAVNVG